MPDPRITPPIHLAKLNKAIADRVLTITGGPFIRVNRTGDAVTVSLSLESLLPQFPNLVGFFKLVASATKPGMYTANPLIRPTSPPNHTASSQLADGDFGVADTATVVYLINSREEAAAGHALSPSNKPNKFIGIFRGFDPNDGKPIYAIDVCQ